MKGGGYMSHKEHELIHKLKDIESVLQDHDNTAEQLTQIVNELKSVVQDLDKTLAIQTEKQSHLFYRIEQLQQQIKVLESSGEKETGRQRDLIEKALMAFLGALITYIFSLAK